MVILQKKPPNDDDNHSTKNRSLSNLTQQQGFGVLVLLAFGLLLNGKSLLRPFSESIHSSIRSINDVSVSGQLRVRAKELNGSSSNAINSSSSSSSSSSDDRDSRPWLILHVGPPKTATTTIQSGLVENARRLAMNDNYYFMGHSVDRRTTKIKFGNQAKRPVESMTIYKLADMYASESYREDLVKHAELGHNVILSAEQFTKKGISFRKEFVHQQPERLGKKKSTQHIIDENNLHYYNAIASNLTDSEEPFFGYRIKVVVAYRHFFEWLASLHFQTHSYYQDPVVQIIEFTETYLDNLVQYDPQDNKTSIYTVPITFDVDNHFQKKTGSSHGSVYAYLKYSSLPELYERVDIFDLHQQPRWAVAPASDNNGANGTANTKTQQEQRDVFCQFVCQNVPEASSTCFHLAENAIDIIRMHSSSKDNDFISLADQLAIIQKVYNGNGRKPSSVDAYLLIKTIKRWCKRQGLVAGADSELARELTTCIDADVAERLKIASWNALLQMVLLSESHKSSRKHRDETYYSSLFQSVTPTKDLLLSSQYPGDEHSHSWDMAHTKAAHDAAFGSYLAKAKYCQINLDKLFARKDFVHDLERSQPLQKVGIIIQHNNTKQDRRGQ